MTTIGTLPASLQNLPLGGSSKVATQSVPNPTPVAPKSTVLGQYKGVDILSNQDVATQMHAIDSKPVITADALKNGSSYTAPVTPNGTTTGALGTAVNTTASGASTTASTDTTTATPNPDKAKATSYLDKILGNIGTQAQDVTNIENDQQLLEKKQKAQALSTELDVMDKTYRDETAKIKENAGGMLTSGVQAELNKAEDRYQNNRANAALTYKVALGDYQGAQDIVDHKVSALKDQNTQALTAYKLYIDSVNNDMTESEKVKATAQANAKIASNKTMEEAYATVLTNAVQNKAPASVLQAIDTAKSMPGATAASILASAGRYGIDALKQAQTASANALADKREGSGSGGTTFTSTQTNKGANNAGVSLETFNGWDSDTKNFFVNTAPTTLAKKIKDTITTPLTDKTSTAEELKTQIDESSLATGVKTYLKGKVDEQVKTTQPKGWFDSVKSFFGF